MGCVLVGLDENQFGCASVRTEPRLLGVRMRNMQPQDLSGVTDDPIDILRGDLDVPERMN